MPDPSDYDNATPDGATLPGPALPAVKPKPRPRKASQRTESPANQLPPYNVVLLNDEEHSYEYVIEMVIDLFGRTKEAAYEAAKTVDTDGRAILLTTHRELAELKVEQIVNFGADIRMGLKSTGSMRAVAEPAS